jgi:hypothetical protein
MDCPNSEEKIHAESAITPKIHDFLHSWSVRLPSVKEFTPHAGRT